jgi:hypothetical protein
MTRFLLLASVLVASAPDALADEGARSGMPTLGTVVTALLVVLTACALAGSACVTARAILPSVAAAADRSRARLGAGRLFLTGVLPIVGVALIVGGAQHSAPGTERVLGPLLSLPLALAMLVGLLAAIPHVGREALGRRGSPLSSAVVGAIVVGGPLAAGAAVPALGLVLLLLVGGWTTGIGLGALFGRTAAPPPEAPPA